MCCVSIAMPFDFDYTHMSADAASLSHVLAGEKPVDNFFDSKSSAAQDSWWYTGSAARSLVSDP